MATKILLVDGAEHVEPFRADRTMLLVLVVEPVEQLVEVQELQVDIEGMLRDTEIVKASHQSDLVSVEDCEHVALGRSELVRTSPMHNRPTKHLHSREAATEGRTRENSCRHRQASDPLLEQTCLRS